MRWRRVSLIAFAFLLANALAVDLSWLYRFATREACPPIRSCLGYPSPWDRLRDWLGRCRLGELPSLLFLYESRELITLLGLALILALGLFFTLRWLGAFRWRFRFRTVLLVVALSAFEWETIRELWAAVDSWEFTQMKNGLICCLDTWIWGDDL
jgi:hypothetical protein